MTKSGNWAIYGHVIYNPQYDEFQAFAFEFFLGLILLLNFFAVNDTGRPGKVFVLIIFIEPCY